MTSWIFVALLPAVVGDPAAPPAEAAAPAAQAATTQPEMRRVCRREDVTGRRFGRRVCTMEPVETPAPAVGAEAVEAQAPDESGGGAPGSGAISTAPAPEATQP